MIFTLVLLLVLIVFMAFFVGKNLTNICTFWFFKTFTNLPVAILALISFGAGIVISILIYFIAKLKKSVTEDRVAEIQNAELKKNKKLEKAKKRLEKQNRKHKTDKKVVDNVDNQENQDDNSNE